MVNTQTPNLFIIGAPKSGTTALADQLGQHPDIYVGRKEPRFFDAGVFYDYPEDAPIKTFEQYLNLFNDKNARESPYILDASVFNMYSEMSIRNILQISPSARFILVLRDPVDAAKSMHLQRLKYPPGPLREVSESFSYCWDLLECRKDGYGFPSGCRNRFLFRYDLLYRYELYLGRLFDLIPDNQLLCLDYEVFKESPFRVHDAIFDFLEIGKRDLTVTTSNTSYVIPESFSDSFVLKIHRIGISMARAFPQLRRALSFISRLLPERKVLRQSGAERVDDEVRSFFQHSYLAMEKALAKYAVNNRKDE